MFIMTKTQAVEIIQNSFSSLHRSGILEKNVLVTEETVILGVGSPLDSIAFVTFITDIEDRLNDTTGKEVYLVLSEIHEHNGSNQNLTVGTLVNYIVNLTK